MSRGEGGIPGHRTIVYIDGYNLYNGVRDAHGRKYLWLNLTRFALSLLSDPRQTLTAVKYFTSQAPGNTDSAKRQQTYRYIPACHESAHRQRFAHARSYPA